MNKNIPRWLWWAALIALLLTAFTLRTWALLDVPPGLTHDEASNGHDSAAILRGVLRIYFPVGYGHEPLFNYSLAFMTIFLGQGIFTLRITTVLWSVLLWALIVALARRWWGRRTALFAAAALTTAFWPLMAARIALRATTLPIMLTASALAYDHARLATQPRARRLGYLCAGLFLGAAFYIYMPARGMPLLYLSYLALLVLLDRARLQHLWQGTFAVVIIALIVAAPLLLHLRANPHLEGRLTYLGGPLDALRAGNPRPVLQNTLATLPMYLWQGDPLWLYNVGGRPSLEPFLAAAFLIGLGTALLTLRAHTSSFTLLWLAIGTAPALLTGPDASVTRAIAALPAAFLLVALGLEHMTTWASKILARNTTTAKFPGYLISGLLLLGFLITGSDASRAYFGIWGQASETRGRYVNHIVALGRHVEVSPDTSALAISSLHPGEFHDPYVLEVTLHREDLAQYWYDGRGALFFPSGPTRLVTGTLTPLDAALAPLLHAHGAPLSEITFRPDDLTQELRLYRWDAEAAWATLQPRLATTAYTAPGDPPPGVAHTAHALPLTFGESVALVGYNVAPEAPHPGNTLTIITAWRVERAFAEELVAFTHLLSPEGTLIAQNDRLDAPNWQWQPGDRFVQLHRFTIPAETPPGAYALQVGFYTREGWHRLPIGSSEPPTTRALLAPLEITAP